MGDGSTPGTLPPGALGVDVNPLPVAGDGGKRVDPALVDGDPWTDGDDGSASQQLQFIERRDYTGHPSRNTANGWP